MVATPIPVSRVSRCSTSLGRPVRLFLTREESFLCVGNRPPHVLTLKAGVTEQGRLTALKLVGLSTGGAYPGAASAGYLVSDLYLCPNVLVEETEVCVNAGRARAFRAPGFPPGAWALEQMMDELAERLSLDPVALRLLNVPSVSQRRGGMPYTSTGLARCLREGAAAFGWEAARARPRAQGPLLRGVGVSGSVPFLAGGVRPCCAITQAPRCTRNSHRRARLGVRRRRCR